MAVSTSTLSYQQRRALRGITISININTGTARTMNSSAMSTAAASTMDPSALESPSTLTDAKKQDKPMDGSLVPGSAPTTLHSFNKLPYEIRKMIWSMVEPEPRDIKQKTQHVRVSRKQRRKGKLQSALRTYYAYSIPGVIHACRESRAEWLLDYGVTKVPRHIKHPVYRIRDGFCQTDDEKQKIIVCRNWDSITFSNVGKLCLPRSEDGSLDLEGLWNGNV